MAFPTTSPGGFDQSATLVNRGSDTKFPHPPLQATNVTLDCALVGTRRSASMKKPSQHAPLAQLAPRSPELHKLLSCVPKYRSCRPTSSMSCPLISVTCRAL